MALSNCMTTRLHVGAASLWKTDHKPDRLTQACVVFYCISVTNSQTVESRHGTDHIDFCLTGCGWGECVYRFVWLLSDVCDYVAYIVGLRVCVCVHLRSVERWCDCADMCPTAWLAPGPLFHSRLAWLPWAPCIMQQARGHHPAW